MKKLLLSGLCFVFLNAHADPLFNDDTEQKIIQAVQRLKIQTEDNDRFAVFVEKESGLYVQLAQVGKKVFFDFPIQSATAKGVAPQIDTMDCKNTSNKPKFPVSVESLMPQDEVTRLEYFFEKNSLNWRKNYCIKMLGSKPHGYFLSYQVALTENIDVPLFIREVFTQVYLLKTIKTLAVEMDEAS